MVVFCRLKIALSAQTDTRRWSPSVSGPLEHRAGSQRVSEARVEIDHHAVCTVVILCTGCVVYFVQGGKRNSSEARRVATLCGANLCSCCSCCCWLSYYRAMVVLW